MHVHYHLKVTRQKNIALIGSTGSIGTQTLDAVAEFPDLFNATVLTAHRNARLLIEQARRFRPSLAVIGDESLYREVHEALAPIGIEVASGRNAIAEAAARDDVDTVLTATVGYSGLEPTMAAIRADKEIALANKETLVVAGELITDMLSRSKAKIIPVDSEHSAIYQCLAGEEKESIRKLIITASGGPFRTFAKEQLEHVTAKDALRHPNWNMGAKITIDSASMMNKAFEIIEARWLFGIEADRIEAVVHPQSIVHSMVMFRDGAVKAQLGLPDMHLPIRYALASAERLPVNEKQLSISDFSTLTFEKPDYNRFPCLSFADLALTEGGNTACIINAANEIAVDAFLHGKIRFMEIPSTITHALEKISFINKPTYEEYVATNAETRRVAAEYISSIS